MNVAPVTSLTRQTGLLFLQYAADAIVRARSFIGGLLDAVSSATDRERSSLGNGRLWVASADLANGLGGAGSISERERRARPPKPSEQRVVFMGNSITEGWAPLFDPMFPGKPYIGRGISGQTTPQMLVRFRQDVIALKPEVVVILGGTNDIAGNTGPSTLEMIEDNLASMTELAKANGIRVVLVSVLPVFDYPWKPGLEPAPKIVALNAWIKRLRQADRRGVSRPPHADGGRAPGHEGRS